MSEVMGMLLCSAPGHFRFKRQSLRLLSIYVIPARLDIQHARFSQQLSFRLSPTAWLASSKCSHLRAQSCRQPTTPSPRSGLWVQKPIWLKWWSVNKAWLGILHFTCLIKKESRATFKKKNATDLSDTCHVQCLTAGSNCRQKDKRRSLHSLYGQRHSKSKITHPIQRKTDNWEMLSG